MEVPGAALHDSFPHVPSTLIQSTKSPYCPQACYIASKLKREISQVLQLKIKFSLFRGLISHKVIAA